MDLGGAGLRVRAKDQQEDENRAEGRKGLQEG